MNEQFFVGPRGAEVSFVDPDGVISSTIQIGPGEYSLNTFRALAGREERVMVDVPTFRRIGNILTAKHPGRFDSSANPTFRVSPADRVARQLRDMMRRTEAHASRAARHERAAVRALEAAKAAEAASVMAAVAPAAAGSNDPLPAT